MLWYLYTYVWLVLLSPVLLWMYRRWRLPTALLPYVLLLLLFGWQELFTSYSLFWHLQNVLAYGTCWVIGMAHRDGDLKKVPVAWVAAVLMGGTLAWG